MKAILRLIESADPEKGGPIFGILQSSRILRERGYQVDIVTLDDPNADFLRADERKHVIALGPPRFGRYSYTKNLQRWLLKHVNNYSVVFLHGVWQWSSFGSYSVLNKSNVPFYLFPHGSFDVWDSRRRLISYFAKKLYYRIFESKVANSAKKIIFTSEEELSNSHIHFGLPKAKCQIIRYGVPEAETNDGLIANELKKKSYILFLARIHPKKGLEILLRAFAKSKLSDNYLLKIAGSGDEAYTQTLEKLIGELKLDSKVEFLGHVVGQEKNQLLSEACLMVLPSYQENFGLAVAESLSLSTPVAISVNVNICRAVQQYGAGYVFSNEEGLVKYLNEFDSLSMDAYQRMCSSAAACFRAQLSINGSVEDIETLVKQA